MTVSPGVTPTPLSRALPVVVLASAVGALPALLLGSLAVLVREELGFGPILLGLAVAAPSAISTVVSLPAGRASDRKGPTWALRTGVLLSALTLVSIAALARAWVMLFVLLLAGGIGNTLTQLGANHLLATSIAGRHQGAAYGVKQSAVPVAGTMAGLALPLLGLTIGWRWAYVGGAVLAVLVFSGLMRVRDDAGVSRAADRRGDAPLFALGILATAAGLGTAAGNALVAFTVEASVAHGLRAEQAGLLLTAGSLLGVIVRILSGWLADHLHGGSLLIMAGLLGVGTFGYVALALADVPLLVAFATLVAFGGGWGYQGLVWLAVAQANPHAPAPAMAVVRLGPSAGAALGPLAFGVMVEQAGYGLAWSAASIAAALAVFLVLAGRHVLGAQMRA